MELVIYNTLTRKKEVFTPLHAPNVGMYVCGPTVYGDPHLGHARPAITFDILFRTLKYLGYKVRYVRNITDVGHLENDADSGEDKIAKKARLEQVEPMEVVQYYLNRYHKAMEALNVLPPSIEPHASGHIIEQVELVKNILYRKKMAYKGKDNSIYFDVLKYNEKCNERNIKSNEKIIQYGILSGRNLNETVENTRELQGQESKNNSFDFALLKKAEKIHIMKWPFYPFHGMFPGWHLECTAMSTKYLGKQFDIHGGGMDLIFPHHECEIAQGVAANGILPAKYWLHNNMITINGKKMGKSLGNFITLEEFFTGTHPLLAQAYTPMTIRFFILQAHYRSTVDFSNEALQASEKGLERLLEGYARLQKLQSSNVSSVETKGLKTKCEEALLDDLNTPIVISHLFEAIKHINAAADGKATFNAEDLQELRDTFKLFAEDLLGLQSTASETSNEAYKKAVDLLLEIRLQAKQNKDWATSDKIRNQLAEFGFQVKDTKDGFEWSL